MSARRGAVMADDDRELARDREVIAAATPGPWAIDAVQGEIAILCVPAPGMVTPWGTNDNAGRRSADYRFAVRARARWGDALDREAKLSEEVGRLRDMLKLIDCLTWRSDGEACTVRDHMTELERADLDAALKETP